MHKEFLFGWHQEREQAKNKNQYSQDSWY
jgi:hypothetical protein